MVSPGLTHLSSTEGRIRGATVTTEIMRAVPARSAGRIRIRRLAVGALAVVVAGALADLLGWNVSEWFEQLWAAITGISAEYVVAACVAGLVQTTSTAIGWWSILRYGFPGAEIPWRQVWAAYAASVALNGILPANLGTLMLLLMFTTLIAGATFAAVLGGYAVQKIFYCVFGAFPTSTCSSPSPAPSTSSSRSSTSIRGGPRSC